MYAHWGLTMKQPLQRRVNITSCWASSRITLLDSIESYEDSYAITQEFREWIICLESKSETINTSILKVPQDLIQSYKEKNSETDEFIEL